VLSRIGGQLPCYVTFTTSRTAELIRANLHRSPLYSGEISGVGPRYCPSIEDKIVRFADKERHQIFLEPEGTDTDEIYVNGFATSLPFDLQVELVRTIVGCERAEIARPGYAVEYDFVLPTQLKATLETKLCRNLFLAGQINGTSGYEEAGAQGILAGINAARRAQDRPAIILRRDQAYLGVLIDDLVTKGTTEPYRMFTSRAEYRLLLRQDNADHRLSSIGHEVGLLSRQRYDQFLQREHAVAQELVRLETTRHEGQTLAKLLKRPEMSYPTLPGRCDRLPREVTQQVEAIIKYAGYVERQEIEVSRFVDMETREIPEWLDFERIPGLRTESRQKLHQIRPRTLGQAGRISGISPADLSLVMVWIRRGQTPA
jgi:tRNA uridine 5-carboxymethylaminomethyl modification enzyme